MIPVAVEGLTYLLSSPATESSPNSAQISPPSVKVKAGGKAVYRGTVNFIFPPGTIMHPAFTASSVNTAPAIFSINPSVIKKVKADGQLVLGEGDESDNVDVVGMETIPGPSTQPVTVSISLKIQDAGQIKVKAN